MSSSDSTYKSNPNLKKEGTKIPFTQEQVEEYIKCSESPIYFAENYIKIVSLDHGIVPFKMYDFQKEMILNFHDNRFTIVKCPRRVGKSTCSIAYALWLSLFREQQNIALLANKEKLAQKLLYIYQLAYTNLPLWMQQGVKIWNKTYAELENGSIIASAPTSSSSIRGDGYNLVLLDEFAFVPNNIAENFYTSVYPVITSGTTTKIIITSCVVKETYVFTPEGIKQISDYINHDMPDNPNMSYNIPRYKVHGLDGIRSGEYFCNNGKTKTRIVRSSSAILECSTEHKFWAYKDGKFDWYKSKELNEGDYISIKYGENIWGNNDDISDFVPYTTNKFHYEFVPEKIITKELAYFLGLYLAEGYTDPKNHRHIISCGDDISYVFEENNLKYNKSSDNIHYTASSIAFTKFLEYFGFDISKKAKEKIIPKRLFSCSKEIICAFLSGFFDGDGCATKRGKISVASSSKELIFQIRILLLNLGILTQYYTSITPPTKKVKVYSTCYKLELNDYNSCLQFYDEIGFRLERKQIRRNILTPPTRKISHDLIPDARIFLKENGLKLIENSTFARTNHATRERCLEIEGIEKFPEIFNPTIKWEKIKSIEESENEVYDFSLDEVENDKWCHSVLYNGIIGHQTPFGLNLFYKLWTDAVAKRNDYVPFNIHWSMVPGRDEKFKEEFIKNTSPRQWQQEMESVDSKSLIYIDGKVRMIGDVYNELVNTPR